MVYFKGILFGTVLLGTPIALMIWAIWKSQGGAATVSFSPMGLAHHLAHSLGFWASIVVLFTADFVPSIFFTKRFPVQILDTLKRLGVDDNTLLLFASDNGPLGRSVP